jgi:hypothetical protein
VASRLWSVIRIRTRAGKAKAERFRPQGVGRRRPGEPAFEGARPTALGCEMVRIGRESGHVCHVGAGILIRPLARALRQATKVVGNPPGSASRQKGAERVVGGL